MWHKLDTGGHCLDDFVARLAIGSLGQGGVFDRVRFGNVQLGELEAAMDKPAGDEET